VKETAVLEESAEPELGLIGDGIPKICVQLAMHVRQLCTTSALAKTPSRDGKVNPTDPFRAPVVVKTVKMRCLGRLSRQVCRMSVQGPITAVTFQLFDDEPVTRRNRCTRSARFCSLHGSHAETGCCPHGVAELLSGLPVYISSGCRCAVAGYSFSLLCLRPSEPNRGPTSRSAATYSRKPDSRQKNN
jgi:hypothetical protein